MQKLFKKYDTNRDGQLSKEELAASKYLSHKFDAVDSDKSGTTSQKELEIFYHDNAVAKISAEAFSDTQMKGAKSYSRLFMFTNKETEGCAACASLDTLLSSEEFATKAKSWDDADKLKVGKVYCDEPSTHAVCRSFGLVGEEGTEPGLPYLLWYPPNKLDGVAYDGARESVDDFTQWVLKKEEVQELFVKELAS